uniref:Uncharacterized protein n=1 Tax=Aegilops tauschii subsp. strangulata TaxID=200361 RepID=A0A452YYP8_AEGTS
MVADGVTCTNNSTMMMPTSRLRHRLHVPTELPDLDKHTTCSSAAISSDLSLCIQL